MYHHGQAHTGVPSGGTSPFSASAAASAVSDAASPLADANSSVRTQPHVEAVAGRGFNAIAKLPHFAAANALVAYSNSTSGSNSGNASADRL